MAQSVKNRKSSPSNMAERNVIGGSKAAGNKGGVAIGHALAVLILNVAEEHGRREMQERESRKDILRRICAFPDDAAHIEFRKVLDEKVDEIKKEAEAAKISLNAYRDANPIASSQYTEAVMWRKLDEAVAAGWKVDFDKPWADVSKAATEHLASKAAGSGQNGGTQTADSKKRTAGRKPTPVLDKAKQWVQSNIIDETTKQVKKDVNLAATVGLMLMGATVAQCDEVIAECIRIRDQKLALEKETAEKAKKQAADAKKLADEKLGETAQTQTTSQGATVKRTKAVPSNKPGQQQQEPVGTPMAKAKTGRYSTGRQPA